MTHEEAVAGSLVEKYLLRELSPDEQKTFEEHYFGCGECAAGVQAASTLIEEIRSHRVVIPEKTRWLSLQTGLTIAAGVAICILYYENAGLRANRSTPYAAVTSVHLRMGSRSESGEMKIALSGKPMLMYVDVPVEAQFTGYEIRMSGPQTQTTRLSITKEQASESIPVIFPGDSIRTGSYSVGVYAKATSGEWRKIQEQKIAIE